MAAAGLVAHEDVADAAVDEGVVRREVRAAGIAEYDVDTLGLQALHDGIDCAHRFRPPFVLLRLTGDEKSRHGRPDIRFYQ